MYTLMMIALVGLLIWKRKKIHWPGMFAGIVLTVLLLGTPIGPPMQSMVHALAGGVEQAATTLLHTAGGAR